MSRTPKPPAASHYIEVQCSINDQWYWSLCTVRTSRMLSMSRGYPTQAKCLEALAKLQAKKIIPAHLKVKVLVKYKMIKEMREDGLRARGAAPMTWEP